MPRSWAGKIVEPLDDGARSRPAWAVFRGTTHLRHWLTNLQSIPTSWPAGGHVHGVVVRLAAVAAHELVATGAELRGAAAADHLEAGALGEPPEGLRQVALDRHHPAQEPTDPTAGDDGLVFLIKNNSRLTGGDGALGIALSNGVQLDFL